MPVTSPDIRRRLMAHRIGEMTSVQDIRRTLIGLLGSEHRHDSDLEERLLLHRWETLSMEGVIAAETVTEISVVVNMCPEISDAYEVGKAKWNLLSMQEIGMARTFEECWSTFEATDPDSDVCHYSLLKCAYLSSTIDETAMVFNSAPKTNEASSIVQAKLDELLPQLDA